MAEEIRFTKSERGSDKLIYLGYMYTRLRENKNGVVWRCDMRGGCNATVTLSEDGSSVVKEPSEHKNHSVDWGRIKAKECVENSVANCLSRNGEATEGKEILKSEVNTEILKQLPLETINIRYPPQDWLHLYTNRSLISREQGAGAGVMCCLFSLYRSLGYGTTSFDGEIIAICECLRNLLCHINKFRNAVILSDSKAAILSIVSKHTPSSQTAEITKMLSQLISLNKRIVFQWIPSHCGILGNENADALAKKGSTATYRPVTKSTYYSVKRFIKSTYLDFNKQNLITQSQGKMELSASKSTVNSRFTTKIVCSCI
ncbi:hypothetical protein ANN_13515 [Periplaneta americana]|uniref:RNase H type-1 domain-containing protein n=1 Tax=Periplaneta americana TaxID=6978 RepID=A0ABQ8TK26_PERAM|nr:hypothetical protein ANN_13515 [Periplaneta americana]